MIVSFIRRLIHYPGLFQQICPHMCSNNMMTIIKIDFNVFAKARTVVITYRLGITNCLCENGTIANTFILSLYMTTKFGPSFFFFLTTFNTSKNVMNTLDGLPMQKRKRLVFFTFPFLNISCRFSQRGSQIKITKIIFTITKLIMPFKTFGHVIKEITKLIFMNLYFRNQAIPCVLGLC